MHAVERQTVIANSVFGADLELKSQLPQGMADIGIRIHLVDFVNYMDVWLTLSTKYQEPTRVLIHDSVRYTMARPAPRILEVLRTEHLTPNMKRVVLGGDTLGDFPEGYESANFKLLIPRSGQVINDRRSFMDLPDDERPVVRTYTLRHFDRQRGEVVVDFMMHSDHGPASLWADSARRGDKIGFAGPGKPKLVDFDADWFLFAGDMSALPAIAANIERLPVNLSLIHI